MRRHLFLLAALIPGARLQSQTQGPPNVVLVMMDDLGYGDLGSYGGSDVRTPNIDRLAREGVRLTDAYANGPVCTPTRAALISGRYQQRVGLEWVLTISPADRELGLPPWEGRYRPCSGRRGTPPGSSASGTSAGNPSSGRWPTGSTSSTGF
jgi:hypothetical protein